MFAISPSVEDQVYPSRQRSSVTTKPEVRSRDTAGRWRGGYYRITHFSSPFIKTSTQYQLPNVAALRDLAAASQLHTFISISSTPDLTAASSSSPHLRPLAFHMSCLHPF